MLKNRTQNSFKSYADIVITIPQNCDPHLAECRITQGILRTMLGSCVLPSVKLYHGSPLGNIEVNNICPDHLLTMHRQGQAF